MVRRLSQRQSIVKVGDPDQVECKYLQAMPVALALVAEPRRVLIVGLGGGRSPACSANTIRG